MQRVNLVIVLAVFVGACGGTTSEEIGQTATGGVASQQSEIRNGTFTSGYSGVGLLVTPVGMCSATLLTGSLAVLTAAHCVTSNGQSNGPLLAPSQISFDFRPATQINNSSFYDVLYGGVVGATQILRQGYIPGTAYFSDVAIVRLNASPFIVAYRYRTTDHAYLGYYTTTPAPIRIADYFMGPIYAMNIVGYGLTGVTNAPTVRREGLAYASFNYRGYGYPFLFDVRPSAANQMICPGDSGGPVLVDGRIWGVAYAIITTGGTSQQQCINATAGLYSYAMFFYQWARSIDPRF
jgi:hypothetical protein